jgi:hypothetical protein
MKRIAILGCLALAMVCGQTAGPTHATVRVPATSNPYLAGMPDRTKGRAGDIAPGESPALVKLSLAGAIAVSFRVSGEVARGPMWPTQPPEGSSALGYHTGSEHGIAGVVAPFESLLGVFMSDQQPDGTRAPRGLRFPATDSDFTTLSPQLKQVFFIGSGTTKSGAVRRFPIPAGATRLFLGTMDEYGWYNNIGSFVVTVTLERPGATSNIVSVDSSVFPLPTGSVCLVIGYARPNARSSMRGVRDCSTCYCLRSWSGAQVSPFRRELRR